jgi:hypothetical protein
VFVDDGQMLRKLGILAVLLSAGWLTSCATSSDGPEGSKHQTATGVSETGYPGGQPKDAESPALSSSTEQQYSRAEAPAVAEKETPAKPAK